MESFRRDYRNAVDSFGGTVAGQQGEAYVEHVEQALEDVIYRMAELATSQKEIHYAKGDLAEAWHTGTFNVDAARLGKSLHAIAPRDASVVDVKIMGAMGEEHAQLKYFRSAEDTAKDISKPKYDVVDQKIVPFDQLDGVRDVAAHLALKNTINRPDVAESYSHTSKTVNDHINMDGVESKPLTEKESRDLVKQFRESGDIDRAGFGLTPDQIILWQDILHTATTAAARAAILSVVLKTAPYLVAIANKAWKTGELSLKDFEPLAKQLPSAMLRSGVAGGLSGAIVTMVRSGILGGTLQQVDPTCVAAGVVLAISAFETSVRATRGEISWKNAAINISEDAIILSAALAGSAAGQALIPIPLVGAMLGNIIGAAMARLAIENTNKVILGIAEETGWTVFGLVDQDYSVPRYILEASGWETLDISRFEPEQLVIQRIQLRLMEPNTINMHVLRRGVVSFAKVAYIT